MFKRSTFALAMCALTLTACDEDTLAPEDGLSELDVQFLALEIDAALGGVLDDYYATSANGPSGVEAQAAEPVTTTYSYDRTRECSAGGSMAIAGTGTRVVDREAGTVDVTGTGTRTRTDCARSRGDVTLTTNGTGVFSHERHWAVREATGTWTRTQSGDFDWTRSSGESGSCSYALTTTVDTGAGTASTTGTICGREIDRSASWDRGSRGG